MIIKLISNIKCYFIYLGVQKQWSLEVRHYHCRFSLSDFYIMDIFRRARHRRHHSSIGQIDSPSDRMVPTPSPQAGPSRGQSPAEPSHGQSPAGPSRGPSPAGPSCGQSPAGPSCGQSPAGPSHGQSPAGPSCGQSPAGPSHGQSPAGPSCGQSPAGPSHGHSPSPLESPIPARHSTVDIADARLHIVPLGDS
ncbi:skin secretory protein xP2-like [Zingiber officinale]|uniref:skin secretory protein xP2-like n=1 Tax=Zingiber officinale TaxID=94328 RepID=UPI001C4AD2DD|nr:skin secretory protein xP2-like [Zingiber officinale]